MNDYILEYLKEKRVCVLAVQMPDGSPHAATLHFAFDANTATFIMMTNPAYRKHEALTEGNARATLVVGTDEEDMRTFQTDGIACLSNDERFQALYLKKFPKAAHILKKDVLFTFTPTWWRFTDWTRPEGKTIYTSKGEVVVVPREKGSK